MDIHESEGVPKFTCINGSNLIPEYWDDNERMDVLFNPFRSRDVNPVGYDRKLMYWKKNIDLFCEYNQRCSFTLSQIKNFFVRNGKQPYCLSEVLEHMIRNKEVECLNTFMKPISDTYWFLNTSLLSNSLSWFKQYAYQTNDELSVEDDKEFVYTATLERNGRLLLQQICNDCGGKDKLYRYPDLSNLTNLSVPTLMIIVQWLIRQKKARTMHPSSEVPALTDTLVKFSLTNNDVTPITTEIANVYILHVKEKSFIQDIENLENQRELVTDEVKAYLKQGMRQLAKSSLKKRKEIEKQIQKKIQVLDNIRSLLFSIEEAKSSGEVLSAHESFLHLFKKYNETINIDHAENVMDKITEAIDTHDDIQTTISKPVDVKSPDEADLESELASLLLEETPNVPPSPPNGSAKRKINFNDLPSVPLDNPASNVYLSKLTKMNE